MSSPTVAFFGATGGVTNAALAHSLLAGYRVAALVRTPEKLRKQLLDQGIEETTLNSQLTIVQGNALDISSVKETLTVSAFNGLPTYIVSGLGGSPKLNLDWRHPLHIATLDNVHICEAAAKTLVTALREIYADRPHLRASKPLLTFVSTTGITRGPEDVPFAMRFLYHQMLAIPHDDKRAMENVFRAELEQSSEKSVFRSVVGVRPTLLAGTASYTDAAGLESVRRGVEAQPALGYSIRRADVGHWIFANVIHEKTRDKGVEGQMISLTT